MKRLTWLLFALLFILPAGAQVAEPAIMLPEQQLENITESNEDLETEDDHFLQQLVMYLSEPMAINEADEEDLKHLLILTPMQIRNFILYRNLVGKLISIYELQAVPGWDTAVIQKIRPYISVSETGTKFSSLKTRLRKTENRLLFRVSQVPERSTGYVLDSTTNVGLYQGAPQKYLLRYTCNFKNLFQSGLLAEKDAGEQFFKGQQKQGFDFYSAHIFIRKMGFLKALAIGDFTVNMGQGLIQWQSLAFKKSADVMFIKRESEILRPFHTADEFNFHRGLGITIGFRHFQATVFGSYRKLDANLVQDTSIFQEDFVSSFQTSGYHRTKQELAEKGIQGQWAYGGNITYGRSQFQLGFNFVRYQFKLPIQKSAEPYNRFNIKGKQVANYSLQYSYTVQNKHVFGEIALGGSGAWASVNGLLISVSSRVDLSILYRNSSKSYQALQAAAFTENSLPGNEKGLYAGVSIRPNPMIQLVAYADFYQFLWLKYRVNKPYAGTDYLLQLSYKPSKKIELSMRYRAQSRFYNNNANNEAMVPVEPQSRYNCRIQLNYQVSLPFTIRSRTELLWYNSNGHLTEQGFLTYLDFLYKPYLKNYSGNIRLQYFETNGYNSRIYAFENDVFYSFSIPVFYDTGLRYYINMNYEFNKKWNLWIKWAQSIYQGKSIIGSGLDEIRGRGKSEVKLQIQWKF